MIKKSLSGWLEMMILSVVLIQALSAGAENALPTPQASGPVDIQANEQEFSGDQVIAKGNVRVLYKDSLILGPMATLFRDPGGNPQRAVFTGHPHLVQSDSKMDADQLEFDIAQSKVVAEGNSHSEVASATSDDKKNGGDKSKSAATGKTAGDESNGQAGGERIITDADRQEYDRSQDKFEAIGHVKVLHGDILVHAEKLQLVYGTDKKPETAIFTGHVIAQQDKNQTVADTVTYSLTTRRLQASGHVRSKVVQPKKGGDTTKKAEADASTPAARQASLPGSGAAYAASTNSSSPPAVQQNDDVYITSNSQDDSRETGRLAAEGDVHVYYQDTIGIGPRVIVVKNAYGKCERVVFIGRSQVTQAGRRWIADHITLEVASKKVFAQGNTTALIIQQPQKGAPAPPSSSQLAGRPDASGNTSISARKIETTQ